MRILLIDNHDSYTFNVHHLTATATGVVPMVVSNDDPRWSSAEGVAELERACDAVIISPGPGHPGCEQDTGGSRIALTQWTKPTLGVCLGHQLMAQLCGLRVERAPQPRHGMVDRIHHRGTGVFTGLPQGFAAVRYHSLAVQGVEEGALANGELEGCAWSADGVCQGVQHRTLPWWGVQFHPESVASEHGEAVLRTFVHLASQWLREHTSTTVSPPPIPAPPESHDQVEPEVPVLQVAWREVEGTNLLAVMELARSRSAWAWWLDSSDAAHGAGTAPQAEAPSTRGRFSLAGYPGGAAGEVISVVRGGPSGGWKAVRTSTLDGAQQEHPCADGSAIWDVLRAALPAWRGDPTLPEVPLRGGYVGYAAYECAPASHLPEGRPLPYPEAQWVSASRYAVVDHQEQRAWVWAWHTAHPHDLADALLWVEDASAALRRPATQPEPLPQPLPEPDVTPHLRSTPEQYVTDVEACFPLLWDGHTYELCLTTEASFPAPASPWRAYQRQRRINPVPYGAYLEFPQVTVASSSPERFLRVRREGADLRASAKPIKGTSPRHPAADEDAALAQAMVDSPKVRAENLMIVDLLRNDLSRVCRTGSVQVPVLMEVESFATVHQLVSTVEGVLRPGKTATDAVAACFPGGSMTGAPKERTMHLIDDLERRPRGVYSGALGYVSGCGGADLSIVIRTMVVAAGVATVGAGGAIVADSDPHDETEEMLLKMRSPLRGILDQHGRLLT